MSTNIYIATEQINVLQEPAEKAGLQTTFKRTKNTTNITTAPAYLKPKYGEIELTASDTSVTLYIRKLVRKEPKTAGEKRWSPL